jgi:hypothetical protein
VPADHGAILEHDDPIRVGADLNRPAVRRDNQDATGASIWMRERRRWRIEGRA